MDVTLTPLPMKEAISFFKEKVMLGPAEFRKLSDEARLKAFAVSGIAKGAELETVFTSLLKAMEQGTPLETFKKECAAIFEKRGWTGEAAWRVDNIFRTNIQTAYNVGRYSQMMKVTATRPYWMYDAVNDRRTRPAHKAMDGKIFPAGHPVWNIWYPPNGFRCRCGVTSLSEAQVKAGGLTVETADPTYGLVDITNPKTGITTPPFSLMPDPGFSYHPGKAYWGGIVEGALERAGGRLTLMPDLKGPADFKIPSAKNLKKLPPLPELLPNIAALKAEGLSNSKMDLFYRDQFQKAFGIKEGEESILKAPDGETVIISEKVIIGKGGRPKLTKGDRGQYIPLFFETASSPDEIWLTPMKSDDGKVILRRRQLKFWRGDDENVAGFAVMDFDRNVWTGVSVYDVQASQENPVDNENLLDGPNGYRRGVLLYRK
ncbi:MAG: hypothetical protein A2Y38_13000 [Spirochaetes bacterium GWB1_59_5]|nr:MAG: hypothetical protein A2Y38_13000 [Spirochaetes bacterium GWB1_59_5]